MLKNDKTLENIPLTEFKIQFMMNTVGDMVCRRNDIQQRVYVLSDQVFVDHQYLDWIWIPHFEPDLGYSMLYVIQSPNGHSTIVRTQD